MARDAITIIVLRTRFLIVFKIRFRLTRDEVFPWVSLHSIILNRRSIASENDSFRITPKFSNNVIYRCAFGSWFTGKHCGRRETFDVFSDIKSAWNRILRVWIVKERINCTLRMLRSGFLSMTLICSRLIAYSAAQSVGRIFSATRNEKHTQAHKRSLSAGGWTRPFFTIRQQCGNQDDDDDDDVLNRIRNR